MLLVIKKDFPFWLVGSQTFPAPLGIIIYPWSFIALPYGAFTLGMCIFVFNNVSQRYLPRFMKLCTYIASSLEHCPTSSSYFSPPLTVIFLSSTQFCSAWDLFSGSLVQDVPPGRKLGQLFVSLHTYSLRAD